MASDIEKRDQLNRWTPEHRSVALSQGWDMFNYDNLGLLQIQRCDEVEAFPTDEAVVDYLEIRASQGDATASLALEINKFFDPLIYPEFAQSDKTNSGPALNF